MAEELIAAADRAERLAGDWLRDAAAAPDGRWREAAGRAALCRRKARLWRLAAAYLDGTAATAAEEERS